MPEESPAKLVVAITGASGVIYGIRLLEVLRHHNVETHLVISKWAARTILHETDYTIQRVRALASHSYISGDMGAAISSGSFLTSGMIVAPCSMRTLAAIATGQSDNLIHRAADVTLKERRKLVLAVREAPLTDIHLENMLKLSRMGVVISPPVPAFYNHPKTIDHLISGTVGRLLDLFHIHADLRPRWTGDMAVGAPADSADAPAHAPANAPAHAQPLKETPAPPIAKKSS